MMTIFENNLALWRKTRSQLPEHVTLGFVPTMGNLHEGHLSLVQQSLQENQKTVVSLFVNPTQFNQTEDYTHYPRTLAADIEKLTAAGIDFCLIPSEKEMYQDHYQYQITETQESLILEGKHRPGHFTGVLTVVMKLFQLVKPTRAYFGEKDYQQLSLIEGMVKAFFLDVEIRSCATVRDPHHFALSSRNQRLSPDGLEKAKQFAQIFRKKIAIESMIVALEKHGIIVEYIETYQNRRYAAVIIDGVRLIDNLVL